MKKLLSRLLLLAPLGVLLIGVNYTVDPANLFAKDAYERGIADALLRGQHVTDLTNFDERLLQRYSLQALPRRPPVLVLGSSRVMLIGEELFGRGRLHNGGVSGAITEDLLAVYRLYTARGWQPDTLIVGLDPWMFNPSHDHNRWRTLATEALAMQRQLGVERAAGEGIIERVVPAGSTVAKLSELVSLSYFGEALDVLTDPARRPAVYRATTTAVNEGFTKHPDNSITYSRAYREQNSNKEAAAYLVKKPIGSVENFTTLSADTRAAVARLVAYARQHGAVVYILLAPYHPAVWQFFQQRPEFRNVAQTEAWCRRFAAEHGVRVIGSLDPARYHLTAADFFDGVHCKPEVIARLFHDEAVAGRAPASASASHVE